MLKPLHTSKIDRALKLLGLEYTTNDVSSVVFEPDYVWIDVVDTDYISDVVATMKIEDEDRDIYNKAIRNLYGGDLNKVMSIEVFHGGYSVELRTDIIDPDENSGYVREFHVGHLVVD